MARISGPIITDHLTLFTHNKPKPPTNAIAGFGLHSRHLRKGDICICKGGGLYVALDVSNMQDVVWFGFMPVDTAVSPTPAVTEKPTAIEGIVTNAQMVTPPVAGDHRHLAVPPSAEKTVTIPDTAVFDEFTPGLNGGKLGYLNKAGLRTIGDLRRATDDQLLAISGIGPKSLAEIRNYPK